MLVCRTPYRISLFGGGSDHPKLFQDHRGKVLSFSINKFSYLTGRELPPFYDHKYRLVYSRLETCALIDEIEHPAFREAIRHFSRGRNLEIHHHGDLPPRSGVGSSSSFVVGMLNLLSRLNDEVLSAVDLANSAIHLEHEILRENVGCQDQIAVAIGGVNTIDFLQNSWSSNKITLTTSKIEEIEERCFLVYTGVQRISSDITKDLFENFTSKQRYLERLVDIADFASLQIQTSESLEFIGELLNESWALKKETNRSTTNSDLDELIDFGKSCGAQAAKILGAGGGGFVLFWLPRHSRSEFASKFKRGLHIPFKIDFTGSTFLHE